MGTHELRLLRSRRATQSRLQERLATAGAALAQARAAADVARVLVDRIGRSCGASVAAVYLLSASAKELRLLRGRGFGGSRVRPEATIPFDCVGPLVTAVRTGRAHWIRTRPALIAEYPDFRVRVAYQEIECVAALPIAYEGRMLGVFTMAYVEAHLLHDDELEFLLVVADLAARALARTGRCGAEVAAATPDQRVRFRPAARTGLLRPRPKPRLDLGRLMRLVSRRQLRNSLPDFGGATCAVHNRILGRWDKEWLERTLEGLLTLARGLAGRTLVHIDVSCAAGEDAVVDAVWEPTPVGPGKKVNLAALTVAREEWIVAETLWRASARAGGARTAILQDENGPRGLRLQLHA